MASLSEDDISCPVCQEIFKNPLVLSCSHSVCKECLQQFWTTKKTQECPVCRRRSSKSESPCNLVLKNLCESFQRHGIDFSSSGSEEICSLHTHKFRPVGEVTPAYREELNTALKTLQEKLKHNENIKGEFEETVEHIKTQADDTEREIKRQFEKLHQFLRDEEDATITALREEEEQKKQMMKEKLEEMNAHISALSHTIRDTEEMLKDNDVCFLKKFPGSMERVQISRPDPQTPSGALIHVPRYLGNLTFRVWEKMRDRITYTPVILDPNTTHPFLLVSDDLTSVRNSGYYQRLPDNPERFDYYRCVLGSEGFTSGSHSWDVEVKESIRWTIGVTTASNQRKGPVFSDTDVWSVWGSRSLLPFHPQPRCGVRVRQSLNRVRVCVDCDGGTVSFSDPVTHTHIHTFTTTSTDTLFPFFWCYNLSCSLKIFPINSQ